MWRGFDEMKPKFGSISLFLILLALPLIPFPSAAQLSQAGEKPTVYKIELQKDGTAIWTVETRIKLETQADLDAFNSYRAKFQANESLANFSSRITNIVNQASTATGRTMVARDFNAFLSTTSAPTGTYGVISYKFTWTNFAKMEGDALQIGDVFAGGMYLSREEALAFSPPSGFEAREIAPKPDDVKDSLLIWYGMRGFASGEPRVLFQPSMNWIYAALGVAVIAAIGGIALYARGRKARTEKEEAEKIEVEAAAEPEKEDQAEAIEPQMAIAQSDEDLILDLLQKAGGEMYQSKIIAKTNFSKSKVSAILSNLKAKGLILKIKKGRENLIRRVR